MGKWLRTADQTLLDLETSNKIAVQKYNLAGVGERYRVIWFVNGGSPVVLGDNYWEEAEAWDALKDVVDSDDISELQEPMTEAEYREVLAEREAEKQQAEEDARAEEEEV